ncbi:hypothetical protein PIB30_084859 [Stylosanthes scabra]|uniref:Uncharacterized protein n=1 Tax=Stylosanthes scabra TaxID=79078 RepID=A0ABU6RT50_9FABA|nr:hypothetical protein [Stylosanthes scabra]
MKECLQDERSDKLKTGPALLPGPDSEMSSSGDLLVDNRTGDKGVRRDNDDGSLRTVEKEGDGAGAGGEEGVLVGEEEVNGEQGVDIEVEKTESRNVQKGSGSVYSSEEDVSYEAEEIRGVLNLGGLFFESSDEDEALARAVERKIEGKRRSDLRPKK